MNHKAEEIEVANILADKGYKVILTNESIKISGKKVTDGILYTETYEQRTPQKRMDKVGVKRCLDHGAEKKADIALIYDKHKLYHRQTIEEGLQLYEENVKYRFNKIIVIGSNGNVHIHKRNKK